MQKNLFLTSILIFQMHVSTSTASDWDCPKTISPKFGKKLNEKPKNWEIFINKHRYNFSLEGIDFYLEHPKGLAQLRLEPDGWSRGKNDNGNYWILCSYTDTPINLIRKIPQEVEKCIIEHEKEIHNLNGLPAIKKMTCS
jgi:hypothetical protein